MPAHATAHRVQVLGTRGERHEEILTPAALDFVARLHEAFAPRRPELLRERLRRSGNLASGTPLDFSRATSAVRADPDWRVAPPAPGLIDRRVEITGPPDRRMTVNALNSGAQVWMADFEDATSPTWDNLIGGQLNLLDAIERRSDFTTPEGKEYRLGDSPPRSWSAPAAGTSPRSTWRSTAGPSRPPWSTSASTSSIARSGRSTRATVRTSTSPSWRTGTRHGCGTTCSCSPRELLGIPRGTVRATVLIETVTAAFEMEEILYELREHSSGLNAGRWDYLFSLIKNFAHRTDFLLPDRAKVTMTAPFMRAYTELLVRTCHRRGAHAIGGMSAHVPGGDAAANEAALAKVRLDKEREAEDGFDGSWVAHPGLVPVCRAVFDGVLGERPHQIERTREDVEVHAADLLYVRRINGPPTPEGGSARTSPWRCATSTPGCAAAEPWPWTG
ncbi:hypothetical protein GCM10020254_17070 [Streptomyces goshikiensis]